MSRSTETWFGQSVPRKEDLPLVTGTGRYVADIDLPGTVDVAFVRSPLAHARVVSIDVEAAQSLPGVLAIYTAADIEGRVGPFTRFVDQEHTPPGLAAAVDPDIFPCAIEVLVGDVARYVGQALVAVVATDRYVAEDACDLVDVVYEELPVVTDVERALEAGAVQVHPTVPGNVQADFEVVAGDPDTALADAPHRRVFRVLTQRVTGHPMETRGVLATVDPVNGHLTVWSSTQVPYMVRTRIAEQLGLPEQEIRVVAPDVGGGFGPKVQVYPEEVLLAHLARELRVPVRWIEDRREHLMTTAHARDQLHFIDVAFDDDGHISAIDDSFLLDAGAYNPFSITCAYNTAAHIRGLFQVPHMRVRGRCVLTNKTFNVPYRGAGRPEGAFAMDRVVYEVARALGKDPLEVLRANLITPEQMPYSRGMPYRDGAEIVYDNGDFPAAFDELVERTGFTAHKARQREELAADDEASRLSRPRRGIGFATYVEGTGIGPFESGSVGLDSTGRVVVRAGSAPHGQSHDTVFSQIVADELGVRPEQVDFRAGDTSVLPYGVGTFASRSAVTAGSAVLRSARKLHLRMRELAGVVLGLDPEDLEVAEHEVRSIADPARRVGFAEVYRLAAPGPQARRPDHLEPGIVDSDFWVPPTVTFGFGLMAASVVVDPRTGFVELEKIWIIHDSGRIINPLVVEGQIQGGVVQGVGAALYEQIVHDPLGQPLTTTLMDYLLPTATEAPEIEQIHLQSVSARNPLGIKGVGEAGTIAPPAAVANAVVDAFAGDLDLDIFDLPLSPSKVFAAVFTARSHQEDPAPAVSAKERKAR
ncbi:MAG: xanthine dehydrogenase, molybdenum binding subunit apoprotein [Marmoricola sp.]|jgi:carbon-monoxide dehydrogenase large subunit|nr:xanthine dehydrogenase, molybdenum binding subunit apoprotein [Marmoricola sp.]